jgi:integrase
MFFFTQDELNRLLDAAEASSPLHGLLLRTCYRHAFRIGEASHLTTANVKGDRLVVRRSKQGKITHQKMAADLLAHVRSLPVGSRLFPMSANGNIDSDRRACNRLMQRLCLQVGIDPIKGHTHALRHSLVHHGRAAGMTYPQLTVTLGHADPKSIMHYDIATEQEAESALAAVVGG